MTLSVCHGQQRVEQSLRKDYKEGGAAGGCGKSLGVQFPNHAVLYAHLPSESEELGNLSLSKPKGLNKRDRAVQECTKCEESAAERDGNTRERKGLGGVGGVIKKALDEACTSTHMFVIIVLFFIYHMYVFFYQQKNV